MLKKVFFIFIGILLFQGTVFSCSEDKDLKLISKEGDVFIVKYKYVSNQSKLIKDMVEEEDNYDDNDNEIEIPVPNVGSNDLPDIIKLMEKGYELDDENNRKELLSEYIQNENWELDKLVSLFNAASYLNAKLILKAIAYTLSEKKITKQMLFTMDIELIFEIQAQYFLRFEKLPLYMYENNIIEDLKKTKEKQKILKKIGKIINKGSKANNLFSKAVEMLMEGNFIAIYYNKKDEIQLGETANISVYIEKFEKFVLCLTFYDKNDDEHIIRIDPITFKEIKKSGTYKVVQTIQKETTGTNDKYYIKTEGNKKQKIKIYNKKTGQIIKTLVEGVNPWFSTDKKYLFINTAYVPMLSFGGSLSKYYTYVYETEKWKMKKRLKKPNNENVICRRLNKDINLMALYTRDYDEKPKHHFYLRLYDSGNNKYLKKIALEKENQLADIIWGNYPYHKYLIGFLTPSSEKTNKKSVKIWDSKNGKLKTVVNINENVELPEGVSHLSCSIMVYFNK